MSKQLLPLAGIKRSVARLGLVAAMGLSVLALQGCAGTGNAVEHWTMTENGAPQAAPAAAADQRQPVTVVFYREGAQTDRPINVYVNGQYQSSLVGNTYTEEALCPGEHRLMVAYNDVRQRYRSKDEGFDYVIGTVPVQYFRVTEGSAGSVEFDAVSSETAQAASGSLKKRQRHTISRVVSKGCAVS